MADTTDGTVVIANNNIDVAQKTRADGTVVDTQRVILTDPTDPARDYTPNQGDSEFQTEVISLLRQQLEVLESILEALN